MLLGIAIILELPSERDRGVRRGEAERPREEHMGKELNEALNLTPLKEGFELYRHKDAQEMTTKGWSGVY
jgi:hypothetical protein